jgi:hypothetical protein
MQDTREPVHSIEGPFPEEIREAVAAGTRIVGENYVKEAKEVIAPVGWFTYTVATCEERMQWYASETCVCSHAQSTVAQLRALSWEMFDLFSCPNVLCGTLARTSRSPDTGETVAAAVDRSRAGELRTAGAADAEGHQG